jgi:hypothetical protein
MFEKHKRWKSKKWTDAAKDQPCTLRLSCCNHNPETTVFAHQNGAGIGMKADDYNGCDACSECHAALDGLRGSELKREACDAWPRAIMRTIRNRLERKIVK